METPTLQQDIDSLIELLEQMLVEQSGLELVKLLRQIRQLALERRAGVRGAAERMAARIAELREDQLAVCVRALIIHFDLANLSEDLHRVQVLRDRERTAGDRPRAESIGAAIQELKASGLAPDVIQQKLDCLSIEPVFTAHPTEAKRRTTRRVLRHLRQTLQAEHRPDLLPRERIAMLDTILSDLTLLWQVDPIRPQRPTVLNEVERGLFFFDGLWEIAPQLRDQMRTALVQQFPQHEFRVPVFIKFGSWIGGDRDGNPFVTHDVTLQTLNLLQRAAVQRHLGVCRKLEQLLVMSNRQVDIEPEFKAAIDQALQQSASARSAVESISELEIYRRWLKIIEVRLEATLRTSLGDQSDGTAYRNGPELFRDVSLLTESVVANKGKRIAVSHLSTWLDQIETFGLQFAALDIRQDSRVHNDVLADVFRLTGVCDDYLAADEAARQAMLLEGPQVGDELLAAALSDQSRETLSLFKCLAQIYRDEGHDRIGSHIISMTHEPSDLLAVLWFWQWGWNATSSKGTQPAPYLPIVPLFETIRDLQRGPEIFDQLLNIPEYARYIATKPGSTPTQVVMVGYSDSTKDGGYLAASWGLFRVQEQLAEVARTHGVRLVVFHGRGGALGRGGGPAARTILSLPPKSVDGAIRMTEQGEVIAERYDDPQIATRHLEQVTWATLLVSGRETEPTPPKWLTQLDQLAESSFRKYRSLIDHPAFLAYFDQATPITQIERLPLGSRPSRRRERRSLADLRAIPWTFAWTQSRHFIPAWFGLGSALVEYVHQVGEDWSELQAMYDHWPMFQAVIDNAELALAKADLGIARRYVDLVKDEEVQAIWQLIDEEFQQTQAAVLLITRQSTLLASTPWLQRSIQERNPYVDPLNLIQIELIRRMRLASERGQDADVARQEELARLTIQGVAAGLRTTG
ncbi:phosphoenolpyruvate carboxylase [Schlesneria paludicola]|uniref:phosphoenolpyruvate carboxylase n=1 Tax=Schlesneria paludicola TaxID=360056 RepID=UPI00029A1A1B|nr:phosphoenolpyruvate carboxylase [Schlesneria paludicola]